MPDTPPRVAVVIPAYNAAGTVGDALRSVLAQTERDLEVVVVDDGSTDGTAEVVRRVANGDRRVRVGRQENGGPASARNHGAARTRAPLIAFFDADDLMPPRKLETQASLLESRPDLDIVYSGMDEFRQEGRERRVLGPRADPVSPLERNLQRGLHPCLPSATMQRRRVFERLGGFRDGFAVTEDWDFYLRAALEGFHFHHQPEPRVLYRKQEGQRSSDRLGYFEDCLKVLNYLEEELRLRRRRRSEVLRLRLHWLTLMRAGALDSAGRTGEARRLVLRSLRFGRRPRNLLEVLRLLPRPARVLGWVGVG